MRYRTLLFVLLSVPAAVLGADAPATVPAAGEPDTAAATAARAALEQFLADAKARRVDAVRAKLLAPEDGKIVTPAPDEQFIDAISSGMLDEATIEVGQAQAMGDIAVVVTVVRMPGRRPNPDPMLMVRHDGQWRVMFDTVRAADAKNLTETQRQSVGPLITWYQQQKNELRARGSLEPDARQQPQARLNSRLVLAAVRGDVAEATAALEAGADVNGRGHAGDTPLGAAVIGRKPAVVQLLLARGANVNPPGEPPLFDALRHGTPEIAIMLVKAGADLGRTWDRETPLSVAVRLGVADVVGLMLGKGARTDIDAQIAAPLLHLAAGSGNLATFHLIKPLYTDLSVRDHFGATALHYVATPGTFSENGKDRLAITHELLAAKVDPHAIAEGGPWTEWGKPKPLHVAAASHHAEVALALLDATTYPPHELTEALHASSRFGSPAVVGRLLADGALVNGLPDRAEFPLYLAATGNDPEKVKVLVARGATVDRTVEKTGRTALLSAVATAPPAVVAALLDAGADPTIADVSGDDAVALARKRIELGRENPRAGGRRYMTEYSEMPDAGQHILDLVNHNRHPTMRGAPAADLP